MLALRSKKARDLAALVAVLISLSFSSQIEAYAQPESGKGLDTPVLMAALTEESTVELTWNMVAGAVRYELWVWDEVDDWQQLDDGSLTDTFFTHSGIVRGRTYYYAVRAIDGSGNTSEWSEYADATAPTIQAFTPTATSTETPTKPVTLTLSATTTGTVTSTPTSHMPAADTPTATPTGPQHHHRHQGCRPQKHLRRQQPRR